MPFFRLQNCNTSGTKVEDAVPNYLERSVVLSFSPKTGPLFWHGMGFVMARKRHSDEDIMKLLREIEVKLSAGSNVMQQPKIGRQLIKDISLLSQILLAVIRGKILT
jgi:hypothetical protein